ncbi:hypothetical protein NDU88_002081 [Pleurodeles waltl]|uniref:Uncharacterized protein n=1 Tax=Pleurodeles waltl TaxID=8319 RepID=A0AAV7QBN2_PLEWA|nr:hypothetical protein NDU88_002081 [Pleurodeles waltl]
MPSVPVSAAAPGADTERRSVGGRELHREQESEDRERGPGAGERGPGARSTVHRRSRRTGSVGRENSQGGPSRAARTPSHLKHGIGGRPVSSVHCTSGPPALQPTAPGIAF